MPFSALFWGDFETRVVALVLATQNYGCLGLCNMPAIIVGIAFALQQKGNPLPIAVADI